jgi:NAD(P)-dependent dehydrogenase (short-subunit alcohol dehydrogenase family)
LLQIDVSSESSILAAAKQVEEKYARLDALVNNAAISGNDPATASLFARLTAAFQTNATGPAIVVETFVPLLDKSNKVVRIVNVTSGAGSISLRLGDPHKHQKMKTLPIARVRLRSICSWPAKRMSLGRGGGRFSVFVLDSRRVG